MDLKKMINEALEVRKKALAYEFDRICERIAKIYSAFDKVVTIKICCNEKTRELKFETVNNNIVSMKKEEWQLAYDVYFTHSSEEVNFYVALKKEIHERLGIMANLIYSENEEMPKIIGLNVSLTDLIIKE